MPRGVLGNMQVLRGGSGGAQMLYFCLFPEWGCPCCWLGDPTLKAVGQLGGRGSRAGQPLRAPGEGAAAPPAPGSDQVGSGKGCPPPCEAVWLCTVSLSPYFHCSLRPHDVKKINTGP